MKIIHLYILIFVSALAFFPLKCLAGADSLILQPGLMYTGPRDKILQDLFYHSDSSFTASLSIRAYQLRKKDSILVYTIRNKKIELQKGTDLLRLQLAPATDSVALRAELVAILQKTGALPAGEYHSYLRIDYPGGSFSGSFLHLVDSSFSAQSATRRRLNSVYFPEKKGLLSNAPGALQPLKNAKASVERSAKKLDRAFKAKGLSPMHSRRGEKECIDLYYKDWFIGFYEIDTSRFAAQTLERERNGLGRSLASAAKNNLEDIQSLFSQTRELKKQQQEQKEVTGEIALSGVAGTGQEEYSGQDDNYYELRGRVEIPLKELPLSMEGYYTSQDRHRSAKASYLKLHYDTEQAKSELLKLIAGYKEQFEQTAAKGKGLEGVYQGYIAQLQSGKGKLLDELGQETGVKGLSADTAGWKQQIAASLESRLRDTLSGTADSSRLLAKGQAGLGKLKDSTEKLYEKALEKYRRAQELEQKISRYRSLLDQYRKTTFFDSVLAYDKIKDLDNTEDLSYKDLAKKAGGLLPEGKARSFITGLTNLDIGIFSKEVSSYTLAGQNLKGLDLGYDLGFCRTSFTLGRAEYVGRDGTLDKYTTWSERLEFRPGKKQKLSLIYYG